MATEIKGARDALEKCYEIALQWEADELAGVAGTTDKPEAKSASEALLEIERLCKSALALPRRNCDVGTAEEQTARYYKFCSFQGNETCNDCSLKSSCVKCEMAWAQMPYEAEEGGDK